MTQKNHVTSQLYGNYIRIVFLFLFAPGSRIKKTKKYKRWWVVRGTVVGRRCVVRLVSVATRSRLEVRNAQKCTVDRVMTTRRAAAHQTKGAVVERLTTTALPTSRRANPPQRTATFVN